MAICAGALEGSEESVYPKVTRGLVVPPAGAVTAQLSVQGLLRLYLVGAALVEISERLEVLGPLRSHRRVVTENQLALPLLSVALPVPGRRSLVVASDGLVRTIRDADVEVVEVAHPNQAVSTLHVVVEER